MDWGLALGALGVIGIPVAIGLTMAATSPGEFRFVRACFAAAAILTLGSFLWLTYEQPMGSAKLICAAIIGAIVSVGLVVALEWVKAKQEAIDIPKEEIKTGKQEPHPLVFQAQFAEMKRLEEFLGNKDENNLRLLFDFQYMLGRNINILSLKIGFIRSGRWEDFQYAPYQEGNKDMVMWLKDKDHYSVGPSGVHLKAEPHDVLFLVTSSKYQQSKKTLVEFVNSALLPETVKKEVVAFDKNINENVELLIRIFDERMHQDENYFIQYMKMNSPFYGVIVSDFARRIDPLKPAADRVLSAIAAHWKINQ